MKLSRPPDSCKAIQNSSKEINPWALIFRNLMKNIKICKNYIFWNLHITLNTTNCKNKTHISRYCCLECDRNQILVSGTETKFQFWYISVLELKLLFPKPKLFFSQRGTMPIEKMVSLFILPFGNPKSAKGWHSYLSILFPFFKFSHF